MTAELTVQPELRFPNFCESWDRLTMRDISSINQGLQIPITQRLTEKIDGAYFYITNEFLKEGAKKSYYIVDPSQSVTCVEADILMTRTGNTGMVVTGVAGAFHNNFFKIAYNASIERFFLYYFLTSHPTQHTLLKLAGTSTIPDLNHGDFYKIAIAVPALPEQRKIADFLTAMDARIGQLIQKRALLTDYKKGVMQQLFTQAIRFKDENGRDFPDWEAKAFTDIFVFSTGRNIKQAEASPDFATPCVRYGELYHLYKEVIATIINRTNLDSSELTFSDGDEILLPSAGEDPLDIGAASALTIKNVAIGRTINILKPKETMVYEQRFVSFYINKMLRKKISTLARGASISNVYNSDLMKLVIQLPSLAEQTKIADFLSAIDRKIESIGTQVTETQTFKRGLLQQMFV